MELLLLCPGQGFQAASKKTLLNIPMLHVSQPTHLSPMRHLNGYGVTQSKAKNHDRGIDKRRRSGNRRKGVPRVIIVFSHRFSPRSQAQTNPVRGAVDRDEPSQKACLRSGYFLVLNVKCLVLIRSNVSRRFKPAVFRIIIFFSLRCLNAYVPLNISYM